jgi:hypothetical protein
VDGYITRMKPNLTYLDGRVPGVDVIHLHHAVWVNTSRPNATGGHAAELFFAAGEEKTTGIMPEGYGYPLEASDGLLLNHMIHNLTPVPTQVYITYTIDFVPKGARAARGIRPVRPHRPGVLVATAGHLHPGGLYTDLKLTRHGKTRRLFRSRAKYFEPAGAVSWDVSMTHTRPDWRVKVRTGDVLSISATYDTTRGSWWESMGIMIVGMADGGPGVNPFKRRVDRPGVLTHGHLPENDNHGGGATNLPDPRQLPDGPDNPGFVDLLNFRYQLGDLSLGDPARNPPVIRPGQSLTFRDAGDDAKGIYHSITSCKPPCNGATGIAYPLADGDVQFESGTLGSANPPATGALQWTTPSNLGPGTYTYFCRIHPFMRGAFRVKQ